MAENDENIIHGMELENPIPNISFGKMLYDHLLSSPLKVELMVDAFTGEKMTAKELLDESCNLAEALRVTGYASNAVIAVISENNLQFFVPLLASLYNRTLACLVNPAYTPQELKHSLNITKPKIVFCSSKCSKKILSIRKDLSYIEKIIIIDSNIDIDGATTIKDFVEVVLKGQKIQPYKFQPMELDPVTTPALVLYSSGTTGLPKGVTLSHHNFVVTHSITWKAEFDPNNPQSTLGFTPFYHSMGLNGAFFTIRNNRRLIVFNRFDEDVFLKALQDYRIEMLTVPPPVMVLLAKSPKVKNYDLSSLQIVGSGAAGVRKHLQEEIRQRFKLGSVIQGYGLTEATLGVLYLPPFMDKPESCGILTPLMSCKVRDPETGKTLGPNQPGELCFKGPLIMLGYYNDEKATKEAFTEDGWLRTGDIGYYDEDKFFYIVDRLKELIKYKGYQVAPAELEGILLSHPKIRDVAVVGKPDELCGELPTAFVVKKDGATLTEKEIQDFVAGVVSPQKQLRGGVIFVSEIPKTPTGKILRKELRKLLEKSPASHKSKL